MGFLSKIVEEKMPNLSISFDVYIKNDMND